MTTPTPWAIRPFFGFDGMHIVWSPDAPAAVGIDDPATAKASHKVVGGFFDEAVARFIVEAHNLPEKLTAADFHRLEDAWEALQGSPVAMAGNVHLGDGWIDGAVPIYCRKVNHLGRTVRSQIGICWHGDGSDAQADAQHIVALFAAAPQIIKTRWGEFFARRELGNHTIVMNLEHAPIFDKEGPWKLAPVFKNGDTRAKVGEEVVHAKSGRRLADEILGTDGNVLTAASGNRLDLRLHKLRPVDQRVGYTILLTPAEVEKLQTLARNTNQDEGRILVQGGLKC